MDPFFVSCSTCVSPTELCNEHGLQHKYSRVLRRSVLVQSVWARPAVLAEVLGWTGWPHDHVQGIVKASFTLRSTFDGDHDTQLTHVVGAF